LRGGAAPYLTGNCIPKPKRGDVRRIFENLVFHGATEQILIDAPPTYMAKNYQLSTRIIREHILKYGGRNTFA